MIYQELLNNAPPHDSQEFLEYLREHNVVIENGNHWLIIENFKYHTPEKPWYTAFHVGHDHWSDCIHHLQPYKDWEWLKKSTDKQTVKRFHLHIYQP